MAKTTKMVDKKSNIKPILSKITHEDSLHINKSSWVLVITKNQMSTRFRIQVSENLSKQIKHALIKNS